MAIHIIADIIWKGIPRVSSVWNLLWTVSAIIAVGIMKWYSMGTPNTSERKMHGRVVMITGGTSGIGAAATLKLAQRGAQIILLVQQSPKDIFLLEFVEDLREKSGNEMIYVEQVDLCSLHSIRRFATKWIDNVPPRRLDMIILCASTMTPPGKPRKITEEGLEETWMVNYVANFHLLSLLSPAIRAQPPDRDVRVIFITCSSYIESPPLNSGSELLKHEWNPQKAYARSKLALNVFAQAFQKHLNTYKRPDGAPTNTRVVIVNPGYVRTPGMRRWLTRGTLWGLFLYLLLWHLAWIFLKSAEDGVQSLLYAAMEAELGRGQGGKLIKECREIDFSRCDIKDETTARTLWAYTEKLIIKVEKKQAEKRAAAKKRN
ncbi:putative oxidoreductase C19A8.06 [Golovinomyces cichoracearum]|uniref:Putative oxidoreductase C19A8.06 n=1 Tax=Golovinomyces cichoracearum TaxID=62708 RepID=A0A420J659_9PEZI|nr:putative oxidoreductase C19A8.06 [Golovinomyces cichoracearum]